MYTAGMLFTSAQRRVAEAFRTLVYCNPFLPERATCEQDILGADADVLDSPWNVIHDVAGGRRNLARLRDRAEDLASSARERVVAGVTPVPGETELYENLVVYVLYYRCYDQLNLPIQQAGNAAAAKGKVAQGAVKRAPQRVAGYGELVRGARHFLQPLETSLTVAHDPAHLMALFFQIRRAFHHIFSFLAGRTMAAARLRAAVWESIFTHDMARYRRTLYCRMADFTTLITGPSGTGKELVARAIALSRYIPFDEKRQCFVEDFAGSFAALSLSALSPTLIESELFGHRRGAFTGALDDRAGWLETCPAHGTVFLDEIGELDGPIQVKLLRVLQDRVFQRLGDTASRTFRGKIVAATHRDLAAEMAAGRFRTDFYYRLCSDLVRTPSLREQLLERPEELRDLVLFIARREAAGEADTVADEVVAWIDKSLGRDYPWPGNFRELEQCVRNVLVRSRYTPPAMSSTDALDDLFRNIRTASLTAEELLRAYCALVYAQTGSYEETARRVKLDRRTVKSKVQPSSAR